MGQAVGLRGSRGQVGRASRSPGQLWQVPIFVVGVLAFVAVYVAAPFRGDNRPALFQAAVASLRQGLVSNQADPAELVAQAEVLLARLAEFPRKAGEIHFLAGSAYFRQAGQGTADARAASNKSALQHFEEALALGVPAVDAATLKYRTGFTLYHQGKDLKRAVELMAQFVDKGADRAADGYGVLVQAYLALPKPNVDAALAASQRQLELTGDRNVEEMTRVRLVRGELLLRKGQRPEALKELELVGKDSPRLGRLQARYLQAGICEEQGLWNRAIPVWRELLNDPESVPGGKATVLYALGVAYTNSDPSRSDEARVSWENAYALGGDQGQAAGIRLGELYLHGPKADIMRTLAIWAKVLENVRTSNDYQIRALTLSRAREILESACKYLLDNQDYEQTRRVAELYKKIAAPGVAEEHEAQAAEGLARLLQEKFKELGTLEEARHKEEVRGQYHRAAVAYAQAALARTDGGQRDIYWRCAECYLSALDYAHAVDVLDKFVALELNEGRKAEAYLRMAGAYVAMDNKDKARQAYCKCIEYPSTPFAYQARYQLAVEEIERQLSVKEPEKRNYDEALQILNYNLKPTARIADSAAHEKSIYKVAELFFLRGEFHKAASSYNEATRLYPNNKEALASRDHLARCYFELARQELEKAKNVIGDNAARVHYQNSRLGWLEQAVTVYESISDELQHKARAAPLPSKELVLLRDALFGAADMKFEMNEFPEALRRYKEIQERYRGHFEGLLACYKIWSCVGYMYDTPEHRNQVHAAAQEAVTKARADLETMPEDSGDFRGPGVWTKAEWQARLRKIEEKLNAPVSSAVRGILGN